MDSKETRPARHSKATLATRAICYVAAIFVGILALLFALLMLLANMNISFSSTPQLGMFVAGWSLVGTAAFAAVRLIHAPSYRRLWLLVPPMICLIVVSWLNDLPANQHLMH